MNISSLKFWFQSEKRDLPWRDNPTPYAVWISEVMLQQTQVAVVIPYFLRWMERFPTVKELAEAPLDVVIKMWEGLGYYSRARYLHEGARTILTEFGGIIPNEEAQLKKIKGLGPYTIGAILSFAFHQKKSAVDGNVIRVLARYFQIKEDISKPATVNHIRQLAEKMLPDEESWIVNEALIELGATICQRKPKCSQCPLKSNCQGYLKGVAEQLPIKLKRIKTEYLYRAVAVITDGTNYLVKRGKEGKIMHDLHEFPYLETAQEGITERELQQTLQKQYGLKLKKGQGLPEMSQSFTRYQVRLRPVIFYCERRQPVSQLDWKPLKELKELAFSSGHRRILHLLLTT